ncbi:helix-turn-helix domain-containing protein [Neobacillus mesonae]|uniref:helix-turn-helix domain-containing protein n=1 Tax=Neobacillus mesonae TaxID=1193713 RepID=UPI00203E3B45|nr:helix-turn-helix transcriptional regulator [Neobacillus mesonae]MCM3569339.1 helix-turn-helix domain-containing protein [Neobacillus mesonae]
MDMERAPHIGKVLKQLRKSHKLTQEKLAQRSSLDRSYIGQLECERKKPSFQTIVALAKGFEMQASELVKAIEELPENEWLWNSIYTSGLDK